MGKSNQKSGKVDQIGGRIYHPAGVVSFLTAQHPTKTAEHVEAESGVPAATVRNWLRGLSAPSGEAIVRLLLAYGPDVLLPALPRAPEWLSRPVMARRQAEIEAEQARLSRALADLIGGAV